MGKTLVGSANTACQGIRKKYAFLSGYSTTTIEKRECLSLKKNVRAKAHRGRSVFSVKQYSSTVRMPSSTFVTSDEK